MRPRESQKLIISQISLMLGVALLLSVLGTLDLLVFFTLSIVGFVALQLLLTPTNLRQNWEEHLIITGLLILVSVFVIGYAAFLNGTPPSV